LFQQSWPTDVLAVISGRFAEDLSVWRRCLVSSNHRPLS
jgi:hypothetical protein